MNIRKILQQMAGLVLVMLFLVGCGASAASPTPVPSTATPTPEPPTATPTPVPPTETPTLVMPTETPTLTLEPQIKILVVGNSMIATYEDMGRKGLDQHMEQLAGSADPPFVMQADALYKDGATLKNIWETTKAREMISEGGYDIVVLQEDIPETDVATFQDYARKFDAEIKESGAKTVLFMAHAYMRLGWISMEEIAQAHRDIAAELDIDVAPVGLAMKRAMDESRDLGMYMDMYYEDREHPNLHGSYLAANIVYATVFGESPIGLAYLPSEEGGVTVTEEEAAFLQRIAWETVQEYQAQK